MSSLAVQFLAHDLLHVAERVWLSALTVHTTDHFMFIVESCDIPTRKFRDSLACSQTPGHSTYFSYATETVYNLLLQKHYRIVTSPAKRLPIIILVSDYLPRRFGYNFNGILRVVLVI